MPATAVGPAVGGIVIAALGISVPFWVFWASNVGIVAALLWWQSPRKGPEMIARSQTNQGPQFYGVLMGGIGVGAVVGSFAQNRLKVKMGPDRVVALGTLATALALVLFGLARDPSTAICACLLAGTSWTVVLTSLYVSTQVD